LPLYHHPGKRGYKRKHGEIMSASACICGDLRSSFAPSKLPTTAKAWGTGNFWLSKYGLPTSSTRGQNLDFTSSTIGICAGW